MHQTIQVTSEEQACSIGYSVVFNTRRREDNIVRVGACASGVNQLIEVDIGCQRSVQIVVVEIDVDTIAFLAQEVGRWIARYRLRHNRLDSCTEIQIEFDRSANAAVKGFAARVSQRRTAVAENLQTIQIVWQRFTESQDHFAVRASKPDESRNNRHIAAASKQ